MTDQLHVAPRPCSTCPYARSTPPGIWHPDEYAKLATYDDRTSPTLAVFACHQSNATGVDTVCRGWTITHADHPAIRLAVVTGRLDWDAVTAPSPVDCYETGVEAALVGLEAIDDPTPEALAAIDKLVARGAGRY